MSSKVQALPKAPELSKHHTVLTTKQLNAIAAKEARRSAPTPQPPATITEPFKRSKPATAQPARSKDPAPKHQRPEKPSAKRHNAKDAPSKRDLSLSSNYLKRANSERRRGKRRSAERLYNLALAHNQGNHRALHGLSELYFDMGQYEKSVKNAASAARLAPKNPNYALQHGDALYKVIRYLEARSEYQRALSLGSSKAKRRLSTVQKKIGQRR